VAFLYLEYGFKKDEGKLFSRACCGSTRGSHFKQKEGRFRLDRRKKFFMMRVVKHWNRLPREVVGAPSPVTFKVRLVGGWWQADLFEDITARCRGVVLDDIWRLLPTQSIL